MTKEHNQPRTIGTVGNHQKKEHVDLLKQIQNKEKSCNKEDRKRTERNLVSRES